MKREAEEDEERMSEAENAKEREIQRFPKSFLARVFEEEGRRAEEDYRAWLCATRGPCGRFPPTTFAFYK